MTLIHLPDDPDAARRVREEFGPTFDRRVEIINCTPHPVSITTFALDVMIPPSGYVARCEVTREQVEVIGVSDPLGGIAAVPVNKVNCGQLTGLPPARPGIIYLVSALAGLAAAAAGRTDILTVDETVRDRDGRIIAATSLARARRQQP